MYVARRQIRDVFLFFSRRSPLDVWWSWEATDSSTATSLATAANGFAAVTHWLWRSAFVGPKGRTLATVLRSQQSRVLQQAAGDRILQRRLTGYQLLFVSMRSASDCLCVRSDLSTAMASRDRWHTQARNWQCLTRQPACDFQLVCPCSHKTTGIMQTGQAINVRPHCDKLSIWLSWQDWVFRKRPKSRTFFFSCMYSVCSLSDLEQEKRKKSSPAQNVAGGKTLPFLHCPL